jgi:hypothetical protein
VDPAVHRVLATIHDGPHSAGVAVKVDLHGFRRWSATSLIIYVLSCEVDAADDAAAATAGAVLTFITGRGKHSKGPSVLFSDTVHLMRELGCAYTMPNPGAFQVELTTTFTTEWRTAFAGRLIRVDAPRSKSRTLSLPSDVSDTHWDSRKQPGVDRVKGQRRDKIKQHTRDCHSHE